MEFPSPEVELPDCQLNWEFTKKLVSPKAIPVSFVGPWVQYGPGYGNSFIQYENGLVVVNALTRTTGGAFFTQNVLTGLPPPNDIIVTYAIADAAGTIYNVRLDLYPDGSIVFTALPGFPNGTLINFVPINLTYYSAVLARSI